MELDKRKTELLQEFAKHLGVRFPKIEIASENAPVTLVATDELDQNYWIYLEDKMDSPIGDNDRTGIKVENKHFYYLHALMSEGSNVFWMSIYNDGYILFFLNDCLTPEQLKVTDEFTLVGVASALHIEYNQPKPVTITGSFSDFEPKSDTNFLN